MRTASRTIVTARRSRTSRALRRDRCSVETGSRSLLDGPGSEADSVRRTAMHGVRPATTEDVEECAGVLAAAFHSDPGTMVFLPEDRERAAILPEFFRTFLAAALSEDAGIVFAGEPITGVASWFGPDRHGPSPDAMGAHGFGAILERSGPDATGRLLVMLGEI